MASVELCLGPGGLARFDGAIDLHGSVGARARERVALGWLGGT